MRFTTIVALIVGLQLAGPAQSQTDLAGGERIYAVCAGCHGFEGQGNPLVGAPGIAGLEPWYLERQLQQYSAGRRTQHPNGQKMAPMARAVSSNRQLGDVVAYIATLPVDPPPVTVNGDSAAGRGFYSLCAACHGIDGQGNESLSAPGLAGLDDWYLVEQLRLFAEGARGAETTDTLGQQMRALSASFDTDEERQDLAAYINSLRTDRN